MMKKNILLLAMGLLLLSCDSNDITGGSDIYPEPETEKTKPYVTTLNVTTITSTSALCLGEASSNESDRTTTIGVCWNTSENPTTSNSKLSWKGYNNRFSFKLSGLQPNTMYYVRAYATNSAGTGYGKNVTFKTLDVSTPSVSTDDIIDITSTTATVSGTITEDGGASITERGICWSYSLEPTILDSKVTSGSGTGSFTATLTGLHPGTKYHARAYATNSKGTAYGNDRSFSTERETFTDQRDGNVYTLKQIGSNQVWMVENLAYLPSVVGPATQSEKTAYYYVYNYHGTDVAKAKATDYYKTYGVLYNWTAAMTACPNGFHLPSDEEWKQMEMHLDMSQSEANKGGLRGTNQGGKLKETGTYHWKNPNEGATNSSGFTALPGGYNLGSFYGIGDWGVWWSSTVSNVFNDCAWGRSLSSTYGGIYRGMSYVIYQGKDLYYGYLKEYGYSVRCVRD